MQSDRCEQRPAMRLAGCLGVVAVLLVGLSGLLQPAAAQVK